MNRKAAVLASAALAGVVGVSFGASGQEIGDVFQKDYAGARGTPPEETTRNLYYGNTVYTNETVETDNGGSTALRFVDDTELRLGSNATVVLDRFVYDPATGNGEAVITLSKGVMRFISGDMNKDGYSVRTATATMAVRGTDFLLWFVPLTGATILSVLAGEVEVLGCGGHQISAAVDESIRVRGDCSGADPVPGRAVPSDAGVDDGGGDEGSGGTNEGGAESGDPPAGGGVDGGDGGGGGEGDGEGDGDGNGDL